MYNKNLKVLSLLLLVAPLAACGGKPGTTSDAGSASDSNDTSDTSEVTSSEPQPVAMTFQEAYNKISSDDALANDAAVNGVTEKSATVDHSYEAAYMSLTATDDDGNEIDFRTWNGWNTSVVREDGYTDKVATSSFQYWSGDATVDPTETDDYCTSKGTNQRRYVTDTTIGIFEDSTGLTYDDDGNVVPYETHGLQSAWGQAYCDWWDKTYGKYSAAYIGMYKMEDYEYSYIDVIPSPNTTVANNIAYFADDYFEDGSEPVYTVDAYEDYSTLSITISGDYGYSLDDILFYGSGNGYAGFVDAEIYQTIKVSAKFETSTGYVCSYAVEQTYEIRNNPNTGAALTTPYVIQTQVKEFSEFAKNGEFTGELKQIGDEFDIRYYDIFYKDADHYWSFTFSNQSPCPYQVDLTATKLNKAMTDGFSWSDPAVYHADGTITLNGAKAHTYTDSEGVSKTIKYSYTFFLDPMGNLVSRYVNENGETVTETYYSSANWAAMNA